MTDYAFYEAKYLKTPVGLNNCGANCWWNALLQSLFSCPAFLKRLREAEEPNQLAKEFVSQIGTAAPSSIALLHKCIIECRKTGKTLDLLSQEGTNNGLIVLLELLGIQNIENLFANRYKITFICNNCQGPVSTTEDMSSIITVYKSLSTEEEFVDYIKGHWAPISDYKCPKCNQIISGTNNRYEKLTMLREILPIVFNKGILTYDKLFLPPQLKFRTHSPDYKPNYLIYEPVAQIEHSGQIDPTRYTSSGHYWARVFRPNQEKGIIYLANDTYVDPGTPGPLTVTPNTHMVFYHLIGKTT